jgi:GT2 family glycosyltransferase
MTKLTYRAPIAIMSFNRPDYLRQVLNSLADQIGAELGHREIYLFQDGHLNPFSGERTTLDVIHRNEEIFRELLPSGRLMTAERNLGIALNFDRAEHFLFEDRDALAAIFFEDDLVVSPHYLNVLDSLIEVAFEEPRVGYVGAYGDPRISLNRQMANPRGYIALGQHWAFGLLRRQWLMNRPYVDEYLTLVRDCDYQQRDDRAIFRLFESWGFGTPASSQDAAKGIACLINRTIKINTYVCYGKYIGVEGMHGTAEFYDQMEFGKAELYPKPILDFARPPDYRYDGILDEQLRWAMRRG